MAEPFFARYPECYVEKGGVSLFSLGKGGDKFLEKYVDPLYFPRVGKAIKFTKYKNKRDVDPYFKIFCEANKFSIPTEWGLPVMNAEAAYMQLAKYGKSQPQFSPLDVEKLNKAYQWMVTEFFPIMGNSVILDLEPVVEHLDMSTSPGYPFTTKYLTKKEIFDKDPLIREWLSKDFIELAVNPNWTCIATNSEKEELRLEEKIKANSIRVFTAMALDATVHGGRLFQDQNQKMYDAFLRCSSAVGMSPFSGNWDRLIKKLNQHPNGFALDESQYDSNIWRFLMFMMAEFRFSCLKPEFQTRMNRQRVITYYRNLVNTVILTPEGVLVMKTTGNPSGSCNTISDNTLVLFILMAYAWIDLTWGTVECTYQAFDANTAKALVGDDNTWTVSTAMLRTYNATSVINVWLSKLKIPTTTDTLEPRPAHELDFLSAHTVYRNKLACPIYSSSKLTMSLLYTKREKHNPAFSLVRACAIKLNAWTNVEFSQFLDKYINWLIEEFDQILFDDVEWKLAKTQIHTDSELRSLYTGIPEYFLALHPQWKEEVLKEMCADLNKRGDNKLQKLVDTEVITATGAAWLKVALNPFYDTEDAVHAGGSVVGYKGMPNEASDASVCRTVRRSSAISKPTTLPAGNWDFAVVVWPHLNTAFYTTIGRNNNIVNARNEPNAFSRAFVCVYAKLTATTNFNFSAQPDIILEVPASNLTGVHSLNFAGLEIVNTTAQLYKGGAVTTGRFKQNRAEPTVWQIAPATAGHAVTWATVQQIRRPPLTTDELAAYPEAISWGAEDGCYNTFVLNNCSLQPQLPTYTQPVMNKDAQDDTPFAGFGTLNSGNADMPTIGDGTNPAFGAYVQCMDNVEMDTTITIFSGLTPESTFFATMKVGLETFPTNAEIDLISLAHPSCPFDPAALKLYSETVRALPAGCKVTDNPSGEWWDSVMDTVVASAETLGELFVPEFTPMIQAGGALYNRYKNNRDAARKPQPKKKAPNQPNVRRVVNNNNAGAQMRVKAPRGPAVPQNAFLAQYDRNGQVVGSRKPKKRNRRKRAGN